MRQSAIVNRQSSIVNPRGPAFTLIEVLVVIVVIGILIAAIGLVGGRVARSQKVRLTETIMKNVKLAIDQFAEENPLGSVYDRKNSRTFGPYPPYQLAGTIGSFPVDNVREAVEINDPVQPQSLTNRLWRDLNNGQGTPLAWVDIESDNNNDDIRALYTYLKLYGADVLSQVPASAFQALPDRVNYAADPEIVNPSGAGTNPGDSGAVDVLGIHDAWGVPLDYFLYVKLEYGLFADGSTGWRVTDRIPVLRSRGIRREVYDEAESSGTLLDWKDNWIFSEQFPSPAASVINANGTLTGTGAPASGWARAKGAQEDYDYVPEVP